MRGHDNLPRLPRWARLAVALLLAAAAASCDNSPHPIGVESTNTLLSAIQERTPRTLDPTASYSNPEAPHMFAVYEPPYAYHYLRRPFQLIPRTVEALAEPVYLDSAGHTLPKDADAERIAVSVYEFKIKPGILYAPHPAFAVDAQGKHVYHAMKPGELGGKHSPLEFAQQGTRELVAEDYVYAFKRQATPRVTAPVFSVFAEYVLGLKAYQKLVVAEDEKLRAGLDPASLDKPFLDFRRWPLEGVEAPDAHTLRIKVKGKYPQWKYWLAMTFTAPVPWEADAFYAQPGMADAGLSLSRWPVGTGPFMVTEFVQDQRMVFERNPNFRGEPYPCDGEPGDKEAGLLADCGKTMPFVDRIVATIEREKVPHKAKFIQGYLDVPEIERVDWGIDFLADADDSAETSAQFAERGYKFPKATDITNWYMGFNWLDPVVGKGDTPEQQVKNRKLRQAISIAIDWEEGYGKVFKNKVGVAAMGPLPASVFGSREGTVAGHNPVTHKVVDGVVVRRSLDEARKLLSEAGYPDGRDEKTGRPLVLSYDYQRVPTPEIKAELDWMIRQYAKLGIQLEIRATDYNQFQEKVLKGKQQVFWWGWVADYPDAENFLFLLYGPNAKAKYEGENAANYENAEYDKLFKRMQSMEDGPEKQKAIDDMIAILRTDSPWAFGYFPYAASAFQPWVNNGKVAVLVRDLAKYYRVDPKLRAQKWAEWNHPIYWPLLLLAAGALIIVWRVRSSFRQRELATGRAHPASEATA